MSRDNKRSKHQHNRREFIKVSGGAVTGATVLTAGCTGDGGNGNGGNGNGGNGDGGNGNGGNGDGGGSDYLTQDLRLMVSASQGGGYDTYSRLVAPYLEEQLGGSGAVVVENNPPPVSSFTEVYNASPNGFNMGIMPTSVAVINQLGIDSVGYDVRDFKYLGQINTIEFAVAQRPDLDLSWEDVKANPTEYTWGAPPVGTVPHLIPIVLFSDVQASDLNFVNYDSGGGVISGIRQGDVDLASFSMSTLSDALISSDDGEWVMGFVDESPSYAPDIPLASDIDHDSYERVTNLFDLRRAFYAPPDTPSENVNTLREALWAAMQDEEFISAAEEAERPVHPVRGEPTRELVMDTYDSWSENIDTIPDEVFEA